MSFIDRYTYHTEISGLAEFILEKHNEKGLYLDQDDGVKYKGFLYYVGQKDGNITYRPIGTKGRYRSGIVVLKKDIDGKLQYNTKNQP